MQSRDNLNASPVTGENLSSHPLNAVYVTHDAQLGALHATSTDSVVGFTTSVTPHHFETTTKKSHYHPIPSQRHLSFGPIPDYIVSDIEFTCPDTNVHALVTMLCDAHLPDFKLASVEA